MATYKQIIEGLEILAQYETNTRDANGVRAGNDEKLYAGPNTEEIISTEDRKRLKQLGWSFNNKFECWERFA